MRRPGTQHRTLTFLIPSNSTGVLIHREMVNKPLLIPHLQEDFTAAPRTLYSDSVPATVFPLSPASPPPQPKSEAAPCRTINLLYTSFIRADFCRCDFCLLQLCLSHCTEEGRQVPFEAPEEKIKTG